MGRKKIRIHRIEDERSRQVTFTKRKNGLMKKAYELSVLCGCRVALIVIAENDRVYQYTGSTMSDFMSDYCGNNSILYENRNNSDMAKILKQKDAKQSGSAAPAQNDESEDDEESEETNDPTGDLSTTSSQDSRPRDASQISSSRPTSTEQPQQQQMDMTPNDGNLPMDQFAGQGQSTGPGQFSGQGQSTGSGQFSGQGQSTGSGQFSGQGQSTGSGQFSGQGQSTGSGQFSGQGQSTGSGQFSGQGQSTGSGQFSGQGQSTGSGQFSGQGQSTGSGQFSGLGQSIGPGQFSGQGQLVEQGHYSGQGRLNPRSSGVRQPNMPYTSSQGMYDSSQSYQQPMTHMSNVGQGRYPYTGNRTTGPYMDQCSTQNNRYPNTGRYDDAFGWPGDGHTLWRTGRRSNAPAAAGSAAALAAASSSAGITDYSAIQPSSDFAQVSGHRISDSMQRRVMPMSSSGADQMLSLQTQGRQQRPSASITRYFPYQQPSRNRDQLQHHLNNGIQDAYPAWQSGPGYAFDRK